MTTTIKNPKLTAKQEAFCVNYFITKNGTQSAIKAGYSPKTSVAQVIATENLRKPLIIDRLAELQAQIPPTEDQVIEIVRENIKMLREIAQHPIEMPVSAGHKITAARELHLLHHLYEPGGNVRDINVVFVIGAGYRAPTAPVQLVETVEQVRQVEKEMVQDENV